MALRDAFFLCGFLIVLGVALCLFRLAGYRLRVLTLPTVFFVQFLLMSYLGIPILYLGLDHAHYSETAVILRLWVCSSLSLLIIPSTWFLLNSVATKVRRKPPRSLEHHSSINVFRDRPAAIPFLLVGTAFLVSAALLFFYTAKQSNPVPLIAAIEGGRTELELAELRSSWNYDFAGKVELYRLIVDQVLPFLALVVFGYVVRRCSMARWLSLVLVLGVASFGLLISLEKALILFLFAQLCFLYFWLLNKPIPLGQAAKLTVVAVLILYLVFVGVWGHRGFVYEAGDRILTGGIRAAYGYVAMFPEYHSYLQGRTLPNPFGLFPWTPFPLTVEVQSFSNRHVLGRTTTIAGSQNAPFWAEGYANFGLAGVVLFAFVAAGVFFVLDRWIEFLPRTPVNAAFAAFSAFFWGQISVTLLLPILFIPLNWAIIALIWYGLNLNFGLAKSRRQCETIAH